MRHAPHGGAAPPQPSSRAHTGPGPPLRHRRPHGRPAGECRRTPLRGQDRRQAASRQRREVLTPVDPGGAAPPRHPAARTPARGHHYSTLTGAPRTTRVGSSRLIGAPPGWGSAGLSARLVWGAAPPRAMASRVKARLASRPPAAPLTPSEGMRRMPSPPTAPALAGEPALRPAVARGRWIPPGCGSAGLAARLSGGLRPPAAPLAPSEGMRRMPSPHGAGTRRRAGLAAGGASSGRLGFRAAAPAAPRGIPGGPPGSTRRRGEL